MRWWYRAVAGGMVSSHSLLLRKEGEIFGSTEMKSKVSIVSKCQELPEKIPPLPSRQGLEDIKKEKQLHPWFSDAGKSYLWFSIKMQRSKDNRLQYYKEGTKFTVVLRSTDAQALKIAAGMLWLVIYLGGVGSRSRRGAGSLKVNKYSTSMNELPFAFTHDSTNINDTKKYLENSLTAVFNLSKGHIGEEYDSSAKNPNFCILSQSNARIVLSTQQEADSSSLNVLEEMGEKYSDYRRSVPVTQRRSKAVLGLPLRGVSNDRFSSPLTFGVIALKNGYVGRIVKFYSSSREEYQKKILRDHLDSIDKMFIETPVTIPLVR
jgi:CRISPR-associated protein Cmr1